MSCRAEPVASATYGTVNSSEGRLSSSLSNASVWPLSKTTRLRPFCFEPHISEQNGRKRVVFDKGHTDAFDNDEDNLPSDELTVPYVADATGSARHDIAPNYSP